MSGIDTAPHPCDTERMPTAPCHGLTPLFSATLQEIRDREVYNPYGYQTAIGICNNECPMRQVCAEQGVRYRDRHTVRAGLRLWIPDERAQLLAIAKGDAP